MSGAASGPPHRIATVRFASSLESRHRGQGQDDIHLPAVRGREPGVPGAVPRVQRLELDDRDDRRAARNRRSLARAGMWSGRNLCRCSAPRPSSGFRCRSPSSIACWVGGSCRGPWCSSGVIRGLASRRSCCRRLPRWPNERGPGALRLGGGIGAADSLARRSSRRAVGKRTGAFGDRSRRGARKCERGRIRRS